jgi:3-hydroxyacyl-[acyl-carrier-protein] dehydratase
MSDTNLSIEKILELLPHRYPFLLVDRVLECRAGESIVGIKNITVNEPQFMGHFPGKPVMPGVLIVEAMAQLSALLVAQSMGNSNDKEVFLLSIDNSKFRQVVSPGDRMVMTCNIVQNRQDVWKFSAQAHVDDKIVAESMFTAMVKTKNS